MQANITCSDFILPETSEMSPDQSFTSQGPVNEEPLAPAAAPVEEALMKQTCGQRTVSRLRWSGLRWKMNSFNAIELKVSCHVVSCYFQMMLEDETGLTKFKRM